MSRRTSVPSRCRVISEQTYCSAFPVRHQRADVLQCLPGAPSVSRRTAVPSRCQVGMRCYVGLPLRCSPLPAHGKKIVLLLDAFVCVRARTRAHTHTHVHTHTHTRMHTSAHTYTCTRAHTHAHSTSTSPSHRQGYYFTGDGCRRDADGYYWIIGRVDDGECA